MTSQNLAPLCQEARWSLGPLSASEVQALPAAVPLVDAARSFGLKRTQAHDLARRGDFPVPLLKRGRSYWARQADILRVLGIEDGGEAKAG